METLHKHFRELTREVFARHGFAQGDLIANWTDVVGPELAAISAPERIKSPRGAAAGAVSGATLHLRAAPGRALDLSYAAPRLIERVNAFLGFGAISAVKVNAAASWRQTPPPPLGPAINPPDDQRLATISDEELRNALLRLGAGLAARAQGSPQGK